MLGIAIALPVFVVCSVILAYLTRKSLRVPGSHGFYRFFAWEAILALILVNIGSWFRDPLSLLQLLSWFLLVMSILVLWLGVETLRVHGRATSLRNDGTLLGFEKTSTLVTSGIYRYIRHPLYASLLFLTWGALLKDITWAAAVLAAIASAALVATARADEKECIRFFGREYEEYMMKTKMFLPFVF